MGNLADCRVRRMVIRERRTNPQIALKKYFKR